MLLSTPAVVAVSSSRGIDARMHGLSVDSCRPVYCNCDGDDNTHNQLLIKVATNVAWKVKYRLIGATYIHKEFLVQVKKLGFGEHPNDRMCTLWTWGKTLAAIKTFHVLCFDFDCKL